MSKKWTEYIHLAKKLKHMLHSKIPHVQSYRYNRQQQFSLYSVIASEAVRFSYNMMIIQLY
jgi:hypothetical protein